jgi:hypothetical protein
MTVLQTVSHSLAEAYPPPCVNTTNKLQPFGHRRGKKKRRARYNSRSPLSQCCRCWGLGVVFWMLIWETVIWDMLTKASTPTSRATAAMVTLAVRYPADTDMPK